MNVIIVGDVGIGKTTLITKLLDRIPSVPYGFITKKVSDESGNGVVYIHPILGERRYSAENRIGLCLNKHASGYYKAFDSVGVSLLTNIPKGSIVVMDELGVMEKNAKVFQKKVLQILNKDYFVIAAIKPKHTEFLDAVYNHKNSSVYNITVNNRNDMLEKIFEEIRVENPHMNLLSNED